MMKDNKEKLTEIIDNMMWIGDPVSHIDDACDTMIDHWFPMFTEMDKKLFKIACVQDAIRNNPPEFNAINIYTDWMESLGGEL